MLKDISLRTKIFFLVSIAVVLSFIALTLIVTNRAYDMAKKDAFKLADETADKYNNEIKAELQGARITSETLATVFRTLKECGLTDRDMMNAILKNTLAQKEYITAFCIAYDPDGLDGKDGQYAGLAPIYDATGRYAPYWNKLGGNIDVEPLNAIDTEDWYIVPKTEKHEYITDPYEYHVQGQTVMLASLVFPILHEGEFIGIISSDITLDKLQDMVSNVNPHGQSGFTEILSNSGVIVAHPDRQFLDRDLSEAMAQNDPAGAQYADAAREAVKNGEAYSHATGDYYTVYIPIKFSSVTKPWSVAVSIPMTVILNNANDIRNYAVLLSIAAIFVISLVLYFISSGVTKPLLTLARAAKAFGEGDFGAEVPAATSNDEIGALSKAFRFMAEKINALITEMQDYANALEEKNVYLNRLNELKDEFLANTSHELKTPINGIIGIVETMIDGAVGPMTDAQKYNLAIVSNSGKRLSNMINDILDFTKLKNSEIALQLKPVDLRIVADTVLALSKPLIKGKDLELRNDIGRDMALACADENRLQQILYNLIGNAVKFTDSGSVAVSAEPAGDGGDGDDGGDGGGGMIAVSVEDTGIGISEDKHERIFESFEQADGSTAREYGGTGLGLSITKKIVELHGGTIRVSSRPGEGSRFTFTLPVSGARRGGEGDGERGEGGEGEARDAVAGGAAIGDAAEGGAARGAAAGGMAGADGAAAAGGVAAGGMMGAGGAGSAAAAGGAEGAIGGAGGAGAAAVGAGLMAPPGAGSEAAQGGGGRGARPRILVVDDEPVNIQVLNNLLTMHGYAVTSAYSGPAALGMIDGGLACDLILLDVMMPKMSGYEVCRQLRGKNSLFDLPIVMLTAKNQIHDVVLGFQSGANDYIQKPFDKDELLARVSTLLELRSASAAAMAAVRAKSQFIANMSHEIRTPLNAIIGLANILRKTPMDERQRDYIDKLRRASAALLGIIDDILNFSKASAGAMTLEREPFGVRQFFGDLGALFMEQASGSGTALRFALDPALPATLIGDSARLRQVFVSLISNAFKFTEKGSVTVRASVSKLSGAAAVLRFDVEDTGIGMSPGQTESIFSAFTQADSSSTRKYGGIGIGLALARQVLDLMGGEISVSSAEGKGTIFSFTCPFAIGGEHIGCGPAGGEHVGGELIGGGHIGCGPTGGAPTGGASDGAAPGGEAWTVGGERADDGEAQATGWERARARDGEVWAAVGGARAGDRDARTSGTNGGEAWADDGEAEAADAARAGDGEAWAAGGGARPAGGGESADSWDNAVLRGLRVLLVEDNEINSIIVSELLSAVGANVEVAENGRVALDMLAAAVGGESPSGSLSENPPEDGARLPGSGARSASGLPFDLVLMDLQMPVMDGYEATRIIKGSPEYRDIPIIALTAHAFPEDRERCLALGMQEHLTKPINADMLYRTLRGVARAARGRPIVV
jgi:signal transduction histidine kinase